MPEGPEIRIAADKIAAALVGLEVREIFFAFDYLKPFEKMLTGKHVSAVESRGKAILIRFPHKWNIFSHNQLYGKWFIRKAYDYPQTHRQLRLAIHNHRKSALLYSASDIEVIRDEELVEHPFLSKLGPDLLNPEVTVDQVTNRFKDSRFYRRRITSLLLDQGFMAGPGNYLRSEIMFAAKIPPSNRPADLSAEALRRLSEEALRLARQSYQTEGITNDLKLVETLKAEGKKRSQYRFLVFNREELPCYRCGSSILQADIGGRRFYYCPECQKDFAK